MFFILTSRWLSSFFYHHQNLQHLDLYLLLPTISPFLMMIKTICLKYLQSKYLTSRFVSSTVWFKLLNFFSLCFDHLKKVLIEKLPLNQTIVNNNNKTGKHFTIAIKVITMMQTFKMLDSCHHPHHICQTYVLDQKSQNLIL